MLKRIVTLIVIMITVSSCTPYGFWPSEEAITSEVLEEVPIGTRKNEVFTYFEQKYITPSYIKEQNAIHVAIRNIRGTFIVQKDLFIRIYLDEEGIVRKHEFHTSNTFL